LSLFCLILTVLFCLVLFWCIFVLFCSLFCSTHPAKLAPADSTGHVIAAAILLNPAATAGAGLSVMLHPLRSVLLVFLSHFTQHICPLRRLHVNTACLCSCASNADGMKLWVCLCDRSDAQHLCPLCCLRGNTAWITVVFVHVQCSWCNCWIEAVRHGAVYVICLVLFHVRLHRSLCWLCSFDEHEEQCSSHPWHTQVLEGVQKLDESLKSLLKTMHFLQSPL